MENLSLLRLFVRVADTGSFSAAAREMHATPSAVSRQISRLEEELGTRLLQRTTRQQTLSEAGEVLLRYARQILEDVDAAHLAVTRLSDAPSGTLRITVEADLANALLSPILPGFLARYPDVRVRLFTSGSMEDLIDRSIDLAIRMGHLEDSSLMAKRLAMSRSLIVASPNYLDRHGIPQHPKELSHLACLSYQVGGEQIHWRFRSGQEEIEVPISGSIHASSLVFLRSAARSALGIAMLPNWMVRNDLENGVLVPILPGFPLVPPATPISAVYPSARNLASKVRVFIEYFGDHMKQNFE
ncbi:LysR family transcriptional regulator [Ruegeria sp. MALMAid1280]|uniref:LysR family transcriptional regulator n=1 Tax=Ruegeria sp. MALMAid1280 TaxID=3411634 RepID=UPI003BA08794